MNVLLVSTSYPRDASDWRGRFVYDQLSLLARVPNLSISVWSPPGVLPAGVRPAATREAVWLDKLQERGGIAQALRRGRIHTAARSAGRGGFAYLGREQMGEAREHVRAYRDFRAGMRRLRKVNEQLVDLLRRDQEATTRQGSRQVGLPAQTQV